MKKLFIAMLLAMLTIPMMAYWPVGEMLTQDYSWTDSNGEDHSIFELTASGKAVVIYFGGYS